MFIRGNEVTCVGQTLITLAPYKTKILTINNQNLFVEKVH